MLNKILTGCGVGLFALMTAPTANAQEVATLVLMDGQRPSGELIDLSGGGFTLRINGADRHFPANDVAAVEFVGGAPQPDVQSRIDAGQMLVVLRNGQIIDGRLMDIGGTRPLRLSFDTPSGPRDYSSNDVAQIYQRRPGASASQAAAPAAAAQAGAILVQGNQAWTASGLDVRKGDRIAFSATGDIMIGTNASSGIGGSPVATVASIRYPVSNSPVGALIARVGKGTPFIIGANTQAITMPVNGQLMLGVNDDHFEDNSGSYTVMLTRLGR
jgi:hypothetical protein